MLEKLKSLWNKNKIRKRLIVYFTMTTLLMGVVNIYSYFSISMFMARINTTFDSNVRLNGLSNSLSNLKQALQDYLASKHSQSLDDYYRCSDDLRGKSNDIVVDYSHIENALLTKDIKNMIYTYLGEADAAVMARRGRDINEWTLRYDESVKISNYINEYIDKLNNTLLMRNTSVYLAVTDNFRFMEIINIGLILAVFAFNIILILWFIYRITRPIFELSRTADEITHGNFDVPSVSVETNDEIGVMADAFNRMTEGIRQYISEIKEKAELQSMLKEREMENLLMQRNLKEAELHALQSQINPHFLFNTLNVGAQLSMLEGADKACEFIENVAELFRYNLRNLDKPVSLGDEIKNIDNYIYILKVRFTDQVEYMSDIDESVTDVRVPCMILQPIVENAFIHGIGEMETGGRIWLRMENGGDRINISVRDNGKGMTARKILEITSGEKSGRSEEEAKHKGHTNGIGIYNILSRLRIFYGVDDVMDIYSTEGYGTEVVLRLPVRNQGMEVGNVQSVDSRR